MPNYNFESLTGPDFEILIRDLLQKELGITLESFKSGRDGGIDLRFSKNLENTLVVQCKHFYATGYAGLLSHLKNHELKKIKKLNPKRYQLATSIGLTPKNKKEITALLKPYVKDYGDIFDRARINNLLKKFPDIEQSNFKLWLTSKAVLDRVLHSKVFNQTEIEVYKIKRRMRLYVQNESLVRAKEILKELNYCIIAGSPGIGKTTLAEILLIDYLSSGYRIIKVASDIDEAYEAIDPSAKTVFYYDDFLGVTTLDEKLGKNEDKKLIDFIEYIKKSPNNKFVLTTREYILGRAKETYERLSTSKFDYKKCTIDLEDYTKKIRAEILFNHIYFSDLPKKFKLALLEDEGYLRVIKHKNYNPRTIEWFSDYQRIGMNSSIDSANYVKSILAALDNPFDLWEHPFKQLSPVSRGLLIVLATLPNKVMLQDLEKAFLSFKQRQSKKYDQSISNADLRRALKELDGNFIKTEKSGDNFIVEFHSPAVRDFMESYLFGDYETLVDVIESASFFDQIQSMENIKRTKNFKKVIPNKEYFEMMMAAAKKTINLDQCKLVNSSWDYKDSRWLFDRKNDSYPAKLSFVLGFLSNSTSPLAAQTFEEMVLLLIQMVINKGVATKDLVNFLKQYKDKEYECPHDTTLFVLSKNFIMAELENPASIEFFDDFFDLFNNFRELFDEEEYEKVKNTLKDYCGDEIPELLNDDNPAYLSELRETVEQLSLNFNLNLNYEIDAINERIGELSEEAPDGSGDPDGWRDVYEEEKFSDMEIGQLFDALKY